MTREVSIEHLEATLQSLLNDYRDLQSPNVTHLSSPPTALEALRLVHRSHPVVINGFSPLTAAARDYEWTTADVYKQISGDQPVSVAITDDGLADSVRTLEDGTTTFVKACEEKMSITDLIYHLRAPAGSNSSGNAHYLQSQDGNVYRSTPRANGSPPDLGMFQPYIERDVAWMKEASGSEAEAVNLWIGDSRSTTSLHHDPYENIYHVLAGSKIFTLLSPIEGLWLDQHFHPASTLYRTPSDSLRPILDPAPTYPIPWVSSTTFTPEVDPLRVVLNEGETLYLPAGWWHRVEQQEEEAGIVVAVNYWYPAELNPERYAFERLARRLARLAGRNGGIPVPGDDEVPDDVWASDSGSGEGWDPADWGR